MELTVQDSRVLFTTHKAYREPDELQSLRSLAQYPPLRTYLAECARSGPLPDAVVVRQVERVAQRITGAVVDLIFADTARRGAVQTRALHLTNAQPAVLLPVVTIDGRRHAVLTRRADASTGFAPLVCAMRGVVGAAGGFSSETYTATLQSAGLDVAAATLLSPTAYTIGNEGGPAVLFFVLAATCDAAQAATLRENADLAVMSLEQAATGGDIAAALAVSLALAAM